MAKLCKEILLKYGVQAKKDVEAHKNSEALEKIIEANIYLSGVGFENNGCAIAHALYSGMTSAIKDFSALHGEAVAYGTIVQLIAEEMNGKSREDFTKVVAFDIQGFGTRIT
jgi:glycerol dehydrogenase